MDRTRIAGIAEQWMIPTSKTSYMAGLEAKPVIAAARGVWVVDTEGKEYLDFGSGQMAAALGHNHPRYVAAVERSLRTISHSTKTFLNVDRLELHERLGQILTPPLQKSLFLVSGSDAIEAAIDLARKATGGVDVLGLHMALHGSTSFVTRSLTFGWNRGRHGLAAPSTAAILSPFCYRCPVGKSFPSCHAQCLASSMAGRKGLADRTAVAEWRQDRRRRGRREPVTSAVPAEGQRARDERGRPVQRHVEAQHIDAAGCLPCKVDRRLDRIAATDQEQRFLQRRR